MGIVRVPKPENKPKLPKEATNTQKQAIRIVPKPKTKQKQVETGVPSAAEPSIPLTLLRVCLTPRVRIVILLIAAPAVRVVVVVSLVPHTQKSATAAIALLGYDAIRNPKL